MKSCVGFMPYVTGHTPSKKFNFCLISSQNIWPKVLEIIKIFLAKVRQAFVYFLVSSGFCLGTLPWMPFLSSLFCLSDFGDWLHHCSKFSLFVDNGSDRGPLESQSLRNGFITISRLIHVNYFVSHLFLNFFRLLHDVLLLKHASLCQTGSVSVVSWFNRSGSYQA